MKPKLKVLILILIILIFVLILRSTYSKYITVGTADITKDIGQWVIKINNTDITEVDDDGTPISQEFDIDTFDWDDDEHTIDGKVSPGRKGRFELVVDPTDTDVSFEYEITIDKPELFLGDETVTDVTSDDIVMNISSVQIDTGKTIDFEVDDTTNVTTIHRVKPLSEIKSETTDTRLDTLEIEFEWQNSELNNNKDSKVGKTYNNQISFHVTVNAIQYNN